MMRRFSRRRGAAAKDSAIDAGMWMGRIAEVGIAGTLSLEPLAASADEVPGHLAALGSGETEQGERVLVSFSPRSAGDALFAGLVVALRLAEEDGFAGELCVVAPEWNAAARRRLGAVAAQAFRLRPVAAPTLCETPLSVEPESLGSPGIVPVEALKSQISDPVARELFARAGAALEGLASKHGGAVRGFGRGIELVVMARRVAELVPDESGISLNSILPQRSTLRLTAAGLSGALDGLEGNLRKRLGDRRAREGDEGLRSRLAPLLSASLGLRSVSLWPVGGRDLDIVDLIGVNQNGLPVVVAGRGTMGLADFGAFVDAVLDLQRSLPIVLAGAAAPVRFDEVRIAIAARAFEAGVARILPALVLAYDLLEVRSTGRDRGLEVSVLGSQEATPIKASRRRSSRRPGRGGRERGRVAQENEAPESIGESGEEEVPAGEFPAARSSRSRSRRGRSRGGRGGESAEAESADTDAAAAEKEGHRKAPRFDEMSSFDLEEEPRSDDADTGRPRRRGRSRRRGRRGGSGDAVDSADADEAGRDSREPPRSGAPGAIESTDRDDDGIESDENGLVDGLATLPEDVDESGGARALPDDDNDDNDDDAADRETGESGSAVQENLSSLLAEGGPQVEEKPRAPRRRVAIVAHADRDSLLGAVLLARDLRLVEGIWVYGQSELMTFFRSVATDLRDETPIYLIGFAPSPARDLLQAAAIYRGRLTWFDHRPWPPEDLEGLRQAIGAEFVHVEPGLQSSLPMLLGDFTRRSRFSDKLVDLAAGRFSEHDYARWGRLWWWRLDELAQKSGQRLGDLDPLMSGRPSDLAKEAKSAELPPVPREVEFISSRDFRLIHFAGHSLVVLEVPADLDLHLSARIARERFSATLSLAYPEGEELVAFAGDDIAGRRSLDYLGVVGHLAEKLSWVEALPSTDHIARILIKDRIAHPERLDDVIGEIAMGRSILER